MLCPACFALLGCPVCFALYAGTPAVEAASPEDDLSPDVVHRTRPEDTDQSRAEMPRGQECDRDARAAS